MNEQEEEEVEVEIERVGGGWIGGEGGGGTHSAASAPCHL